MTNAKETTNITSGDRANLLRERYIAVRTQTIALTSPLSDADATVQSMEDASPAKWHLAHTSWFFETFLLKENVSDYSVFSDTFSYLFNSYYEAIGERHARPQRGMLTRPSLSEVMDYRNHVDAGMRALLMSGLSPELSKLVELGLHHEQQHQELILTDVLHLFAQNPTKPAFRQGQPLVVSDDPVQPLSWHRYEGGNVYTGHEGSAFAFDCETPRHQIFLQPFKLASRAVTNGEWMAFIADGGYTNPALWLSDGISLARDKNWQAPLYWEKRDNEWWSMTLRGFQPVDPSAPVCHVSFYEADAFAAWANKRLPREGEWEHAAQNLTIADQSITSNFVNNGRLRPKPQHSDSAHDQPVGMFGDVWEWTASAFSPYPGFKVAPGAVGEYNGKFMSGQMVLRGGSCVTPHDHMRATYRNFFQPEKRWQFSGLRLADDI